jgi:hypothetical protein
MRHCARTSRRKRAKIVYERLVNVTDDTGIKNALGFLMTREIARGPWNEGGDWQFVEIRNGGGWRRRHGDCKRVRA